MFRTIALLAMLFTSSHAVAQETESVKFVRLDFVLRETESGKVVNSRAYFAQTSTARNAPNASIRTGSRVPIVSGSDGSFTYIELGVSVDCSQAKMEDGQLSIHVTADISSVLQETPQESVAGKFMKPTIRQNKWSGNVLVALKKPTVVFSSDDLTTKRQMQLELTATQIK